MLNLGFNALSPQQKMQFNVYTERVAYRYTFEIFYRNGYFNKALNTLATAISLKVWGSAPANYVYPYFLTY